MAASAVDQRPPVDGDLVRSYLRDIGRVPLLSHEQEITLGRQVQELVRLEEAEAEFKMRQGHEPSREEMASSLGISPAVLRRRLINGRRAKERMVAANLRLVVSVAKKYTKRNMELLDLIQEGTIGLVRGVEKFDPTRGYKFSTYAYWWIRQAITRSMTQTESHIRLPMACVDTHKKLRAWVPGFVIEHKRYPSNDEMAEHCGISKPALLGYLTHIKGVQSLDVKVTHNNAEGSALIDLIPAPVDTPLQAAETSDAWEVVQSALPKLTEQQRFVLSCHWGLEGSPLLNLREIGTEINRSREYARNIESKAIRKVRVLVGPRARQVLAA